MNVIDALYSRKSIRAYKSSPVDREIVVKILEAAKQSPSWANTQPWQVYAAGGDALDRIRQAYLERFEQKIPPGCDISMARELPQDLRYRRDENFARRFESLGIDRNDKAAIAASTIEKTRHNYGSFGAPVVVYLCMDRSLLPWSMYDLGMFSQSMMLTCQEYGIGTAPSILLVAYPDIIRRELAIPDSQLVVLGIALGYEDTGHPANKHRSSRRPVEEFAKIFI